ncbi:MAG: hypothetical protein J1E02_02055 [Coprobacter sp.]|nr:hypothetical protein [Coprobacter sp.]
MGSSKKIVSGVAWTTLVNVVNGVYGFISVPMLIAYYGKSDYGLIGLAMSVNVYLRLMDLGFNSTNVRFFSNWLAKKEYFRVNRLFQTSLAFYGIIGFVNAVILLVLSIFSDCVFNVSPEQDVIIKHLLYILSISAFISWFTSCFDQLIRANEYVGWTQKITLLPKGLQIIVLTLTVTIGLSIEWYYTLTAFSMFVVIPFMVTKIRRLCPFISFKPAIDKNILKQILPYCLNVFSFGFFQFSMMYLRPVFLGMRSVPASVADYQILNGIITIVLMIGGAFIGVFLPSASKVVAKQDKEAQDKIAYQGTRFISIIICFCCFGMMSVAPEILSAYVGTEYLFLTVWLDLWLLATLASHNQAISSLVLAGADIRAITISTIVASVIGLSVCWFAIPKYDIGGTVIAYCVYCLIQILFYYLYYWPKVMHINSLRVFLTSFIPFVLIGVAVCFCLRMVYFEGIWISLFLKGGLFCLIYALFSYMVLGKKDRAFITMMLKKERKE